MRGAAVSCRCAPSLVAFIRDSLARRAASHMRPVRGDARRLLATGARRVEYFPRDIGDGNGAARAVALPITSHQDGLIDRVRARGSPGRTEEEGDDVPLEGEFTGPGPGPMMRTHRSRHAGGAAQARLGRGNEPPPAA